MRALITGIRGFVGPYLAALLRSQGTECVGISYGAEATPHPISLDGVRVHQVDIRHRQALRSVLESERPDRVFHLAAMSHVAGTQADPELTFDVNVVGTFNLFEGLRQVAAAARVLFVSTGNLYGDVDSGDQGFSEDSPVHATSPYASSKLIGEQLARSYVDDFGMQIVIARPFNHTGPGQSPAFACPRFARAVAQGLVRGKDVVLTTGRLDVQRDLSDVRDVVRAYALLAERGTPGEIYNVCSGSMVRMEQVVTMLAEIADVHVTTVFDPAKSRNREIFRLGGDCSRIRTDHAWRPEIPLQATLRSLLDYWVAQCREQDPLPD